MDCQTELRPRGGTSSCVIGPPGSGKSRFFNWWTHNSNGFDIRIQSNIDKLDGENKLLESHSNIVTTTSSSCNEY